MTTTTRLERELPNILGELSAAPTPEYLDDVFARTGRMRQRPGWTFPERWFPMADVTRSRATGFAPPWRTIALALVVIAVLVAAAFVYAGSQQTRLPAPFGPAQNGLIPYASSGDIYVGDPVTGESRLIVGGSGYDSDPGFSPDGTLIAFFRSAGAFGEGLFTAQADGSDVKQVTELRSITWVSWTPDSRHLAVVHDVGSQGRLDMYHLTGRAQQLAGDIDVTSIEFRPPLGREILFRGVKDGHYGLFAMGADGSNLHSITTSQNSLEVDLDLQGAVYSADGDRIFYQHGTDECCELWVIDADGTNQHRFLNQPANGRWEGQPAVSPDGQWIAFWHVINDSPTQRISVARADETGPEILTGPDLTGLASWTWAPDSSKILMVPSGAAVDDQRAYLLDPAGGAGTTTVWHATSQADWQRLAR
jgi:Tol biopolymer transport system component